MQQVTVERLEEMDALVKALFRLWQSEPEQRLLQLLTTIMTSEGCRDGFYYRDADLLESLTVRLRRNDRAK
jgi:hypothetical protein